jgi:general secretion pathway protein G
MTGFVGNFVRITMGTMVFSLACGGDEESSPQDRRVKEKSSAVDAADLERVQTQIAQIEKKLNMTKATTRSYPATADGLDSISRLFEDGEVPVDPWGNEFQYTFDGYEYEVLSLGKDGRPGGSGAAADISSKSSREDPIVQYQSNTRSTEFHELGAHRVTLSGPEGDRILVMEIAVEANSDSIAFIVEKEGQVRDVILQTTGGYSVDEIGTLDGKVRLRDDLLEKVRAVVMPYKVERIYFTSFMVQAVP